MNKYLRLISFLKDLKKEVIIKVLIALFIIIFGYAQAIMLAKGTVSVLGNSNVDSIIIYLMVALTAIILKALLIRYQECFNKEMASKAKTAIRDKALNKILSLGPGYLNNKRSGNFQSLLTDGIESFEVFLVSYIPQVIVVIISTIAAIIFISTVKISIGILISAMTVLSVIIPHVLMPAISNLMIRYWEKYAQLNSEYIDAMQGMNTLKAFNASRNMGIELAEKAKNFSKESIKNTGMSLADSAAIILFTTIGSAASVVLAVFYFMNGAIDYSQLIILLFITGECMKPLYDLNTYWHGSYLGFSVAEQLFEIIDTESVITENEVGIDSGIGEAPEIEIENMNFKYNDNLNYTLKNINTIFESGKTTAVVGKSGSGKTTFINLLLRFYDTASGKILIEKNDIKDYSLKYLRENISVVFQETYLFYGTVEENIIIANDKASFEDVVEAAKAANAHDFIMNLPQGYKTIVGERGARLSGGEKQRISIARAILKKSPILLLDEATSSVDIASEELIQEALEKLTKNKTTIIIAHRLSTIENADNIIVFENGMIAEIGKHHELCNSGGAYSRLIQAQKAV